MQTNRISSDITVLADSAEIPGLGFLPVNAFVIHAEQPVVVDTGLGTEDKDFVSWLADTIDPADVRWIWLTHPDRDHTGGLYSLLEAAPQARLVTSFIGVGILSCERPVPLDRVYLLNPGQRLDVGDRTLRGLRPPLYDSPVTTGFVDESNGVLMTSDCFGAPLQSAEAAFAENVKELAPDELRDAQLLWAQVDSPWVSTVDRERFRATIEPIRQLDPSLVISTHLPPAQGLNDVMIDMLHQAPDARPYVGPDQAALEELLATFEPEATPTPAVPS